ncbi:MAG: ATP-dependent DNA helicase PIF1 [Candidatus Omnitrophota bacterium]|jgi:ATP-dependent DNA helicase PIF1
MTEKVMPTGANNKDSLDFNAEFTSAYDLLENSNNNVFITGKAGTGKSTLLNYFRKNTLKNVAILAPTGVAAINVQGQTIHSFFGFKPDITPDSIATLRITKQKREMYKGLDTIVIDEISMVRADLLDCVNKFLKMYGRDATQPFGGVQVAFFGDMFQLPPVVSYHDRELFTQHYKSPYFFHSHAYAEVRQNVECDDFEYIELSKVYRQTDEYFISMLNSIRDNSINSEQLDALNENFQPDFTPTDGDFFIYLTTTNKKADMINQSCLKRLHTEDQTFEGEVDGLFAERNLPTHNELELKLHAQIMLLNNDPMGRWFNGSLGKIISFHGDESNASIRVELATGAIVSVKPFTWEMFKFYYDEESSKLISESVGSYTQFPLRLAWAVTIHKSQGKSFDRVIVDTTGGTFAHGQLYVALTRCRSLEGLILKNKIVKKDIIVDHNITEFMKQHGPQVAS